MKKSELKKIIRESIGELMKEHVNSATNSWIPEPQGGTNHTQAAHHQNSQYPLLNPHAPSNGRYVAVYQNGGCENIGTGAQGHAYSTTTICMTVNGGQVPQQGQKIMIGGVEKVIKSSFDHAVCYGLIDPSTGDFYPSLTPGTPGTIGNFTDHQTVGDCQSTSSGCDPSAWSNHQNWITQFTSMPHFSSSNPNQPCNMICNKLQIWNNNLSGAGPVQTNQLNCKIAEGQNQSQIHGCNC